jgi:hypothetical protein
MHACMNQLDINEKTRSLLRTVTFLLEWMSESTYSIVSFSLTVANFPCYLSSSIESILPRLGGTKAGRLGGRNLQLLSRLRIPSLACRSVF